MRQSRTPTRRWVVLGSTVLLIITISGFGAAQDTTGPFPDIIERLANYAEEVSGEQMIRALDVAPEDVGAQLNDPTGDLTRPRGFEVNAEGPDLLGMRWYTIKGTGLSSAFEARQAAGVDPDGLQIAVPEGWTAPVDSTLIVFVVDFDRPVPTNPESPCEIGLRARGPGPTTIQASLEANDPDRDANHSYRTGSVEGEPWVFENMVNEFGVETTVPNSTVVGVTSGDQVAIFIRADEAGDLEAVRASMFCATMGYDIRDYFVQDFSDFEPFAADATGMGSIGPEGSVPTTSTTTTTLAVVTSDPAVPEDRETPSAVDAPDVAVEIDPGTTDSTDGGTATPDTGPGLTPWIMILVGVTGTIFGIRLFVTVPKPGTPQSTWSDVIDQGTTSAPFPESVGLGGGLITAFQPGKGLGRRQEDAPPQIGPQR